MCHIQQLNSQQVMMIKKICTELCYPIRCAIMTQTECRKYFTNLKMWQLFIVDWYLNILWKFYRHYHRNSEKFIEYY